MNRVVLTNYTTTGVPAIAADSQVEIDGAIYTNPGNVAITGATVNTTWYDILLTPSGTSFTASFIARNTGVWSDSLQGLYSGNNRVVACAFRSTSSTVWINKNILIVNNRLIKVRMDLGDWDLVATDDITVQPGIPVADVRSYLCIIRSDFGAQHSLPGTVAISSPIIDAWVSSYSSPNVSIYRRSGGTFDNTNFDATSYNRGWLHIEYEV